MLKIILILIMLFITSCVYYNPNIVNKGQYYQLQYMYFMQNLGNGQYLLKTRYCPMEYDLCEIQDLQYRLIHIHNYPKHDIVDGTEYINTNETFYYGDIFQYTNVSGSLSTVASLQYIKK